MPAVQVQPAQTPPAEPVTLAQAVAWCRLDLDPDSTDPAIVAQSDLVRLLITAAREQVEAYTGRYFVAQTLLLTYRLDEAYALPAGAVAESVSGFINDLNALADWAGYLEDYRKGISISRDLPWAEALAQTYTVTATIAADAVVVPALAKSAILELVAEAYRNRETTAEARGLAELPVSWRIKLASLVLTPLGENG